MPRPCRSTLVGRCRDTSGVRNREERVFRCGHSRRFARTSYGPTCSRSHSIRLAHRRNQELYRSSPKWQHQASATTAKSNWSCEIVIRFHHTAVAPPGAKVEAPTMIAFENYRLAEGRRRTEATMERLIVRKATWTAHFRERRLSADGLSVFCRRNCCDFLSSVLDRAALRQGFGLALSKTRGGKPTAWLGLALSREPFSGSWDCSWRLRFLVPCSASMTADS